MKIPLEFAFPPQIGSELIYSFVIILCSLMVYYATKEMYELSSHKGIKFFRQSFIFFAVAYFFRYFIQFFLISLNLEDILEFSPFFIGGISLFVFLYSSSMAIFYLLYSVMWKKWNNTKSKNILFNTLAIIIALIGTFTKGMEIYLFLNFILLIFVTIVLFVAYKDSREKKKGKNMLWIYFFLFLFWILNVINIMLPRFLEMYQIWIYLISIFLFMAILYKVLRKAGD
jgi:hypothetical protein